MGLRGELSRNIGRMIESDMTSCMNKAGIREILASPRGKDNSENQNVDWEVV